MIRQFVQRACECFFPKKIHNRTPERRPSEIFSPQSSSRKASVYEYVLFEKILERKLQALKDKK